MSTTIIIGTQWGDEGKGKIIDYLTPKNDVVVRFQGGNNAGHTINVNGTIHKLHLIPSGVLHPGKKLVLGNGLVLDLEELISEFNSFVDIGITPDLLISNRANIIMPYHQAADNVQERKRGKKNIGTTQRGIGPAYTDKISRQGIRMCDLRNREILREKIERGLKRWKNFIKIDKFRDIRLTTDEIYNMFMGYAKFLLPMVTNTTRIINDYIDSKKKNVLFEGSQGVLLDIDFGTYPFVTSSHTVSGGVTIGTGVGPTKIDKVIGVIKAYTTRVGKGPFPTELKDQTGKLLREKGCEIGATTGRTRRCGWLDLVILKHSIMVGGVTAGALTKIDVLTDFDEIKVCTGYMIDGEETDEFPPTISQLEKVVPVYTTLPGPFSLDKETIGRIQNGEREKMPRNLLNYIEFIENELEIPIEILSFSPRRSDTLDIDPFNNPINRFNIDGSVTTSY